MKKIMIVDDDIDLLLMLKHALKSNGYSVFALSDGSAVIRTMEIIQPDMIILDIHMPPWDGRDICLQIKERHDFQQLPVVLYSALPEDKEAVKRCRADYFLQKPLSTGGFIEQIRSVMDK